jgi:hypothetical protein
MEAAKLAGCSGATVVGREPLVAPGSIDYQEIDARLFSVLTNKAASDEDLLRAISRLGKVTEPASFWTKIADDPSYSLLHRTRAILALFRRHCGDKTTCHELRNTIAPAQWMRESLIQKFDEPYAGLPPFSPLGGDTTVFRIRVLCGPGVCVELQGKVDIHVFSSLLRGDSVASSEDPGILQYGIADDYEDWYFNRRRGYEHWLPLWK